MNLVRVPGVGSRDRVRHDPIAGCRPAAVPAGPLSAGQEAGGSQAQPKPEEPPTYEEVVVVTGSKIEQKLVDAAATMTVLTGQMIQGSPSQSFADLMRAVPGLNVTQISARDVNMTSRGATSSLATGQLTLLDGRSIYLDFFGFVMWDFLPVNFGELKQIEVIRGPASAVWGANALHGVVNVITKAPREMQGTTATLGFGGFSRPDGDTCLDSDGDACGSSIFYVSGTHAQAVNDRWAFKLSAGAYTQDPMTRPSGQHPERPHAADAVSGVSEPRDHAAEVRHAVRLRPSRRPAAMDVRRRRRGDRRHHALGHRAVRHQQRQHPRLLQGGLQQGRPEGAVLHEHPERGGDEPAGPRGDGRVPAVRLQDEHVRRRIRRRPDIRGAARRVVRRQRPLQLVRPDDRARPPTTGPKGASTSRTTFS